ncbi:MAG: hypothetical protein GEU93_11200 [Propionibacteriales bacterium]|nr:hypothetical protein [Propionibacteriales bacterium]
MADTEDTFEEDDAQRYEGLPEAWSLSAREVVVQVLEENPHLDAAGKSIVYEAAALVALADRCYEQVTKDGMMVPGSSGQLVEHPLIGHERQARSQAAAALKQFVKGAGSATKAGQNLVASRWRP